MNLEKFSDDTSTNRMMLVETFVRIVDAGSLSAAARLLGTTQPTVSRRLKALETSLGVRLLQRSTHAMTLTDDGMRCYQRARELIAGWQAFESEIRGAGDEPVGLLRVIAPHAFGQQQLVAPLAEYLKRYPRMTVEWTLHDRTPDLIGAGIDCVIRVGDDPPPDMVAIRLGEVPRIVVAASSLLDGRGMPAHPDALPALPWIAASNFYRDEVVLSHAASGATVRLAIRPRLYTDNLYTLRNAALLGVGVALGSHWALHDELDTGRLVQLVPQWQATPLPIWLIYPPARFYPARLRRFIEIMRVAVPQAFGIAPVDADGIPPPPR
ncbi:LysR family transcriptional regulator [uncultured Massilia sp.]|uniref:LysR family transcriptional regulator n=1 Tax=uncultured Massilia sp. TaxID=169973 RepID=UPI0025D1E055|nr:LysR family transcriptional regulator [uncultured Massilia sp.]